MSDEHDGEFWSKDQFPDAAQGTAAFFAIASIRALRRILDFTKTVCPPELVVDLHDIWDCAKQFFPEEFGKIPNADRISKAKLLELLHEYGLTGAPPAASREAPAGISLDLTGGLQCRYCDKPVSSTSGKTLHEKACKRRPPAIDPKTGELLDQVESKA